ncbi:hypothetical protein HZA42_00080 [Candidatus Peregrinibacteria bacterium]|nr:hypothetical protein [Candidatus Peregrinibacteria bacterium]
MLNFTHLTDKELFELCREYGTKSLTWRKKFIGLLPEVNRRKLYEKKGCLSIFEFAAKLCGVSEEQVRLALNLEKRFEDKPSLKALLVNGEESINKLARAASIATPKNEKELAAKIKFLSKNALETFVRDEKYAQNFGGDFKNRNGLFEPLFDSKSLPGHSNPQQNFRNANAAFKSTELQLSNEVTEKLLVLQQKGIDVDKLLLDFLDKRDEEIANKKAELAKEIQANQQNRQPTEQMVVTYASRYIPVAIKKLLCEEYGTKCSIPTCRKPAQIIHHAQRFSLSQNHDPRFLAPLCKEHHAIAHSIDFQYHCARDRLR